MMQPNALDAVQLQSSFLRKVVELAGASAFGPLLLLLAHALLTRLYSPVEYGLLGIFEATLAVLVAVSMLSYNLAIPVPAAEQESGELLVIALSILLLFSSAIYLACLLFGETFLLSVNATALKPFLWLLPVAVFASGLFQSLNLWALRVRKLDTITRSRLAQGASQVIAQLGLGAAGFGTAGLLYGLTVGRVVNAVVMLEVLRLAPLKALRHSSLDSIIGTAWKYRRFPLLASFSGLINVVSLQIFVLFIAAFFPGEAIGWFSLAFMVVGGPVFIINAAIFQAYLSETSGATPHRPVSSKSSQLFSRLCRLGFFPAGLLMLSAPDVFSVLFGGQWRESGLFAAALIPSFLASFVGSHLPAVVILRSLQRQELWFNSLLLGLRLGALSIGAWHDSALLSVVLYSGVSFLSGISYDVWLLDRDSARPRTVVSNLLRELLLALCLCLPVLACLYLLDGTHVRWAAMLSVAAWVLYLYRSLSGVDRPPIQ